MVTFTRFLYCYDEVVLNLLFALLKKKDFKEVIFWFTEIFHSGFLRELTELIWTFYYDFYALYSNIPFYKLNGKLNKFKKSNDIIPILECLNIFFQSEPHCEIFIITRMLKLKRVHKITNIENVFKIIESAIANKKIYHVINYLNAAITQDEETTIKHYNIFIQKINNKKITLFKKNTKNTFPQLINHLFKNTNLNINKVKKKRIKYIPLSNTYIEYYNDLIASNCIQSSILQEKRHYGIRDVTGLFTLKRDKLKTPISEVFWYNWEYYSKNTPFWKEKFNKYNVKWDNKNIVFANDDKLEEFYEKHSYELDELPYNISHKSIKEFDKNLLILDFLYKYFKTINLPLQKNKIDIKRRIQY